MVDGDKVPPDLGQDRAFAGPLHHRKPDKVLQRADLEGYRGLGQAQLSGRAGHAAGFLDRGESAQLAKRDAAGERH